MIDNAYSLKEVADFMEIDVKSLKQMDKNQRHHQIYSRLNALWLSSV